MSTRREFVTLRCGTCGETRAHPDGFPDPIYAECWKCAWSAHLKSQHKRWWNAKIVRPAKKAARARYLRDETDRRIAEAPTEFLAKTVTPRDEAAS